MRQILAPVSLLSFLAGPLLADACEDDIRALYSAPDGLFDPTNLVPQEHAAVWEFPDGTTAPYNTARWESPTRVLNETANGFYLLYDGAFYQGTSWDGPWTAMGQTIDYDPVDFARSMNDSVLANLADMRCDGEVELEGRKVLRYAYHARTEPPEGGSWWEADLVLYVDAKTGQRVRMEEHALSESGAPGAKDEIRVTRVTPLPGYTIPDPPAAESPAAQ
ncbi:hypothetical protein [uncultured Maritimibacter sp.]|jgi:hypothetical protein|uniref:hypothetical protein n=1 Tax=uncultured Maritimibacter sp. TaxID=991866 RepID=UPI0026114424|nr:hypothetical protein [uncultured Maritimibacter sp.]